MKNFRKDGAGKVMADFIEDGVKMSRYVTPDELKKIKKSDIKSHNKYKADKLAERDALAQARKTLEDTHDAIVRSVDLGEDVPADIKAARVEAWGVIDEHNAD